MTDPTHNPLELATFGELVEEIKGRCNAVVLVWDRKPKVSQANVVGVINFDFNGGTVAALGLLDYGHAKLLRSLTHQDEEEAET